MSAAANTIVAAFLRKKNQDALVAAKLKAEESDRLKSAFLANMSHEIRTPMNGIPGFISLLQEPDLTGEEKDQYISIVKKSGDRLLSTIHDIIDISKIEAGQMTVIRSSVNLNEISGALFAFFQKEAELKGLQFSIETKLPDVHAIVETDRDMLNSILTNLIKNALKYTQKGRIDLGYDHQDGQIHFYVKDTGIGIPADKREIIFDRFVQADVSHTRYYEGSGLGLSISKAYVEMLGGAIWFESEENKGSVFHFSIPCPELHQRDDLQHTDQPEPVRMDLRPMRILVVEDDQVNYEFIHAILKMKGHKILHAETGAAAIGFCRKDHAIDLVFMDIKMPGMDGFEATKEIRKFNPAIPIIALTAFAMQGDPEKAIEAGCSGYLSKPVRKEDLLACISVHA